MIDGACAVRLLESTKSAMGNREQHTKKQQRANRDHHREVRAAVERAQNDALGNFAATICSTYFALVDDQS